MAENFIDKFKQGTYPQRITRAVKWIDDEIRRTLQHLAKDARFLENPDFFKSKKIYPLEIIKALLLELQEELQKKQRRAPDVFALDAQIACVKRELALRRAVYKKKVSAGEMKPEAARREYDAMKGVLETLQMLMGEEK